MYNSMNMERISGESHIEALVELYSYKVADMAKGKRPLGGVPSVPKLRQYLMSHKLPGPLRREFGKADRVYRSLGKEQKLVPNKQASDLDWSYNATPLIEQSIPAVEADVLEGFKERVYWIQTEQAVAKLVPQLVGGDQAELRLAYSLLLNFNSLQRNFRSGTDLNLTQFAVVHPIPPPNDPLGSLTNPEMVQRVLLDVLHLAFQFWRGDKGIKVAPGRVVEFLGNFLQKIIEDPIAISVHSSDSQLSVVAIERAIEETKSLPPADRAAVLRVLQGKLRAAEAYERQVSNLINEERKVYREAAQRLIDHVRALLPPPLGERGWPEINPKILGSDTPGYGISLVAAGSSEVTVKLLPVRFELKDVKMSILVGGGQVHLSVGDEQVLIIEPGPVRLAQGIYEVLAFRSGSYAHIRLEPRQSLDLLGQIALARSVAYLISPSDDFGYIRLMRAITVRSRGEADLSSYGPQSALQYGYARADLEELSSYASKGFKALWESFSEKPESFDLISEVGAEMGLAEKAQTLEMLLYDAINRTYRLEGELALDSNSTGRAVIAGMAFEFDASSEAVVVTSGLESREMRGFLVWPTPDLTVALAQEGRRIGWVVVGPQTFRSKI